MSPPLSPTRDEVDRMDAMSAGWESRAASDASSDWGDWADKQVAQGDTPGDTTMESSREGSGVSSSSGKDEEDEQWVRKQMEQPSAVLTADNRAWDYVLQMVVDEGEEVSGAATVTSPVQEVTGAAATEFVSRWLRSNLPIALPSFNALGGLMSTHPGAGAGGRAVVDSVAAPSAVAVASCSPEQTMHRVNLFSLAANAGSALAAALVQPGAAGLAAIATAAASRENTKSEAHSNGELLGERPHGAGGPSKRRGVVFESLDSRIHMDSLVPAMERLGLGVKCRSRSGLWRLRPGAVLLPTAESNTNVTPLTLEDASFVSRCCGLEPGGELLRSEERQVAGAEALVRGLIRRNPSAGIRRGNQLVAWCLSFDNGLAGVLHVAQGPLVAPPRPPPLPSLGSAGRGEKGEGFSPQNLVLAVLASLLVQPSDSELQAVCGNSSRDSSVEGGGMRATRAWLHQPDKSGWSAPRRAGLPAVVIDDESPFVDLFEELGLLERVCDADWRT
eukprot:g15728.t1